MKKTIKQKTKKELEKITGFTWRTSEEVYRKASKNKAFTQAYKEETARIRLAKQIRELRGHKKMTQKAVADKAHMPQSVLARIESGTHSVSVDTLNRVATALGKEIQLV
jgi:ribosome-binding protein aMBF1 (putative translation factor)